MRFFPATSKASVLAFRVLALAVLLLPSLLCSLGATRIKDIKDHPERYDGKRATIRGTVTDSTNVLVVKFYSVSDGTGELVVIPERAVPEKGATVRVRGVVHQAFAVAGKSFTVLVEGDETPKP